MKRIILPLLAATLLTASPALAGDVGIDLNVRLGNHRPAPVIVHHQAPLFLAPPRLGFHVAVGVPYDMVFLGGRYYLHDAGRWYIGANTHGPWRGISSRQLPYGLAKKRYAQIRHLRDVEYARYQQDRHSYRGRGYYPDREYRGYDDGRKKYSRDDGWKKHGRDDGRNRYERRDAGRDNGKDRGRRG